MGTLLQTNTEKITVTEPQPSSVGYITAFGGIRYPVEFIPQSEAKIVFDSLQTPGGATYTDHKFVLTITSGKYKGSYTGVSGSDPFVLYNGYLYYLGSYLGNPPPASIYADCRTISKVPFG